MKLKKKIKNKEYYGTYEIARMFHVAPGTAYLWAKKGLIPGGFYTMGGHFRVLKKDLLVFMKRNKIPYSSKN